jgi:hypothetical protein
MPSLAGRELRCQGAWWQHDFCLECHRCKRCGAHDKTQPKPKHKAG